jgi:hypothetical protein
MWVSFHSPWENRLYTKEPLNNVFDQSMPMEKCACVSSHAHAFEDAQERSPKPWQYDRFFGPNSNTFMSMIVKSCGLPFTPGPWPIPWGWGPGKVDGK